VSTRSCLGFGTKLVLSIAILLSAAAVSAAKFDQKIRAPRAASAMDFKSHASSYFKTYEQTKNAHEAGGLIRDPAAYAKWFDAQWRLTQGLDERLSLGDLREFGLERAGDGSYTVNVKNHPQWMPIDLELTTLREPTIYDTHARELKLRGFRNQDLAILKNYLESNNWQSAAFAENKVLTESFAAEAQSRERAKRPVTPEETMSYVYQRSRNAAEARRAWAVGLLDALDKQRQRILLSYFEELDTTRTFGPPGTDLQLQLKRTVDSLLSGEYRQALQQEAMRLRK
jgi:hypothetical protein